jgi:IMP dehydrogenase
VIIANAPTSSSKHAFDCLVIDTAHGTRRASSKRKEIKKRHPETDLIAGNVGTTAGAQELIDAGVDAIKVGIGPDRSVRRASLPARGAADHRHFELCSSRARRMSGDLRRWREVFRRRCEGDRAGADVVMIGSLFAGTEEAPAK